MVVEPIESLVTTPCALFEGVCFELLPGHVIPDVHPARRRFTIERDLASGAFELVFDQVRGVMHPMFEPDIEGPYSLEPVGENIVRAVTALDSGSRPYSLTLFGVQGIPRMGRAIVRRLRLHAHPHDRDTDPRRVSLHVSNMPTDPFRFWWKAVALVRRGTEPAELLLGGPVPHHPDIGISRCMAEATYLGRDVAFVSSLKLCKWLDIDPPTPSPGFITYEVGRETAEFSDDELASLLEAFGFACGVPLALLSKSTYNATGQLIDLCIEGHPHPLHYQHRTRTPPHPGIQVFSRRCPDEEGLGTFLERWHDRRTRHDLEEVHNVWAISRLSTTIGQRVGRIWSILRLLSKDYVRGLPDGHMLLDQEARNVLRTHIKQVIEHVRTTYSHLEPSELERMKSLLLAQINRREKTIKGGKEHEVIAFFLSQTLGDHTDLTHARNIRNADAHGEVYRELTVQERSNVAVQLESELRRAVLALLGLDTVKYLHDGAEFELVCRPPIRPVRPPRYL
jgi:hypothetical protein